MERSRRATRRAVNALAAETPRPAACQRLWRLCASADPRLPDSGPLVPNPWAGCDDTTLVNFPTRSDDGPGARLFYDPGAGAFRAGRTTALQWDWGSARGVDSVALGVDTVAAGTGSVAIGTLGAASGAWAFALGTSATAAHDHALVWAGAAAAASTAADQVTLGGSLRLLAGGGDAGLHSAAAYLDAASMFVSGPVRLRAVATPAVVADAGTGAFFVGGSGTTTVPMFQYATGVSVVLGSAGVTAVNVVVFTADGTYTPPVGLLYAIVEVVGGGGGGGGCSDTQPDECSAAAGGGAGGYARSVLSAAAILPSQNVWVGAGGLGGDFFGVLAANGTNSSFGALVSAGGGMGCPLPPVGSSDPTVGVGGSGGVASAGMVLVAGATAAWSFSSNTGAGPVQLGSLGGSGPYGAGGRNAFQATGGDGRGYGSGGGGTANGPGQDFGFVGGSGAPGVVIITEFVA